MEHNDAFKTCPFCQERIRQEAVKCRYCGEWIDKSRNNPEPVLEEPSPISAVELPPSENSRSSKPAACAAEARDAAEPATSAVGAGAPDTKSTRNSAVKTAPPKPYWESVSEGGEDRANKNFFEQDAEDQLRDKMRKGQLNIPALAAPAAAKTRTQAATALVYAVGLLLIIIGFFLQDAPKALHIPPGVSAVSAARIAAECATVLAVVEFGVWYKWFKGRTGSVVMLLGLIAVLRPLEALVAHILIVALLYHA